MLTVTAENPKAALFVVHPFPPLYDRCCRVLILGTMPSPKSRQEAFFYGHPQNRFWKVLAALFGTALPSTKEERAALALRHHVALWDVLKSCQIRGASDSSIANPQPQDLGPILKEAPVRAIFTTGTKAAKLYKKLTEPRTGRPAICLPSPSAANARYSLEDLCQAYSAILPYLRD